jgi:septal ring factor EnvC (AmiA/AmiB activator)
VLALGVSLASSAHAQTPGETQDQLDRLIRQMDEREAVLHDLARQERSITRALGELDESIAGMDAEAARLDVAVSTALRQVGEAELQAARLTGELERAETRLTRRLRSVLHLGPAADIQVLLGSTSLSDLIWRRAVLRRLAARDATLVRDVHVRRAALLVERQELTTRRSDLARARAEVDRARRAAAATRAARAESLTQVATQKLAAEQVLADLSAAKRRLTDLVDDLPPSAAATGFAALKGRLPWPTEGEVTVPFGPHRDEATGTEVMHGGLTVSAPLGQQVHAMAPGRVVHAGWLRGFGQLLILDHGGGFHVLLAHLSRITVQIGDDVTEGDVVAYAGDSESLHGPCLYLELRAKGRPVDPARWLRKRP